MNTGLTQRRPVLLNFQALQKGSADFKFLPHMDPFSNHFLIVISVLGVQCFPIFKKEAIFLGNACFMNNGEDYLP